MTYCLKKVYINSLAADSKLVALLSQTSVYIVTT